MTLRAISLFSGVGGFELGLERAGVQTLLQVENDPWCLSVLKRHWPDVERVYDVRQVDAATLPGRRRDMVSVGASSDAEWMGGTARGPASAGNGCLRVREPAERSPSAGLRSPVDIGRRETGTGLSSDIDLVYGGFPCQDLSVAGKRAGLSGERSGLWHEFHRVLSELRPRWCLIENVPGLLSSNGGADFGVLLRGLGDVGYGWAYRVLDARWFGVPQRRRRVFIVGCLGNARRAAQVLAVCESCGGHPQARGETGQATPAETDDGARRASVELPMIAMNNGQGEPNVSSDGTARTLQADAHNYVASTLSAGGHPESNMPGRHHEDDDNLIAFDWQASAGNDESWRGKGRQHVVRSGDYAGAVSATRTDAVFGSVIDESAARPRDKRASGYRMDMESETFVVASPVRASDGHHGYSSGRGDGADNLIADPISAHEGKTWTHEGSNNFRTHNLIGGVRRLTPLECERLQGWPDDHTRWTADGKEIPDSHRYRMIGNGVVATVAEWLGHRLVTVNQRSDEEAVA